MELEQRVAELERRLTALERRDSESPRLGDGDFWALDGLKQQLAEVGEAAADGGVLYTGSVRLPTGESSTSGSTAPSPRPCSTGTGRTPPIRSPRSATRSGCGCSARSSAA